MSYREGVGRSATSGPTYDSALWPRRPAQLPGIAAAALFTLERDRLVASAALEPMRCRALDGQDAPGRFGADSGFRRRLRSLTSGRSHQPQHEQQAAQNGEAEFDPGSACECPNRPRTQGPSKAGREEELGRVAQVELTADVGAPAADVRVDGAALEASRRGYGASCGARTTRISHACRPTVAIVRILSSVK
jgi:hypothetical protein